MPTNKTIDQARAIELRHLIDEMFSLAANLGEDVADAVRLAAQHPLPEDRARRLYTSVLVVLKTADRDLDDEARSRVLADVETEVERFVPPGSRPGATDIT